MAQRKWDTIHDEEGGGVTYVLGGITIGCNPRDGVPPGWPVWMATHHEQEIRRGEDLQEVMDYCERFLDRVS